MGERDETPDDLVSASDAATIAFTSTRSLRRWAEAGRISQYEHPDRSGYWYSRAEMEAERAKFRRVS